MDAVADLYAGERWIPELGLYDLRNRFMSPELGRFLQTDPTGFKGDASNLYRYCNNDPVDHTDPLGLKVEETLLKKLIENLKKLEKHQPKDHQNRTQATQVDGTPGKEVKGTIKTKWDGQRGGFRRDKLNTEVLPEDNDSIAGTSHYHSSPYYKVKGMTFLQTGRHQQEFLIPLVLEGEGIILEVVWAVRGDLLPVVHMMNMAPLLQPLPLGKLPGVSGGGSVNAGDYEKHY